MPLWVDPLNGGPLTRRQASSPRERGSLHGDPAACDLSGPADRKIPTNGAQVGLATGHTNSNITRTEIVSGAGQKKRQRSPHPRASPPTPPRCKATYAGATRGGGVRCREKRTRHVTKIPDRCGFL